MKLLFITNGVTGSGGLERVLSVKTNLLIEKYGYEVSIISLNEENLSAFYSFNKNITFYNIKINDGLVGKIKDYIEGLRSIFHEFQPDIISVCDDGVKGLFLPLIFKKNIKFIYERHASKEMNFKNPKSIKSGIFSILMNYGAGLYDKFIVLTDSNKKEWKTNNIISIPNPLSFYPSQVFQEKEEKKVIMVGSHSYIKGLDRLLNIWAKVYSQNPSWNLEIFGKIDKDRTFIRLANKLNLKSTVKFFDPVNDIESEYLQASIFALSSRSEGFGMVIVEAMACGLACIAYDCPSGTRDIITDGIDGFLIPEGDEQVFIEKLQLLMNDHNLRYRMGEMARKKALKYKPENILPQWDKLYKSL